MAERLTLEELRGAVAVIGAGPAGVFTARALLADGRRAALVEADRPGAGAGGNPLGLVKPFMGQPRDPLYRFYRAAFAEAERAYAGRPYAEKTGAADVRPGQVAHVLRDDAAFAQGEVRSAACFAGQGVRAGPEGGVFFGAAFTLRAAVMTEVLALEAGGCIRAEITGFEAGAPEGPALFTADGRRVSCDAVVFCVGAALTRFFPGAPVGIAAGQITCVTAPSGAPSFPVSGDGYLLPAGDGTLLAGATFERGKSDVTPTPEADAENLRRCAGLLTAGLLPETKILRSRASVRSVSFRRRPLVGRTSFPRVYINGAHGARGLTSAPAAGELIAALVAEELDGVPLPDALREFADLAAPPL